MLKKRNGLEEMLKKQRCERGFSKPQHQAEESCNCEKRKNIPVLYISSGSSKDFLCYFKFLVNSLEEIGKLLPSCSPRSLSDLLCIYLYFFQLTWLLEIINETFRKHRDYAKCALLGFSPGRRSSFLQSL